MINNKEKNFISAVVYVHNNERELEAFLSMIAKELEKNFNKYEIICVNDCSTDGSVEVIKKMTTLKSGVLSVVNMSYYQGLELSMNAGVDLAIGDFVFEFDSCCMDFSPSLIMKVYHQSLKGYDIVGASPSDGIRMISRLFYSLFNKTTRLMYPLKTERFRLISRRGINRVHAMSKTIPYRKAIYANCGLKLDHIMYERKNKEEIKKSKVKQSDDKETAVNSIVLFTDLAYKVSIILAVIMMVVTIGIGIYTMHVFLGEVKPVAGWTTTMMVLSGAFFAVFAIFAIIIKYLSIIIKLIFSKQKYLIESVDKITK